MTCLSLFVFLIFLKVVNLIFLRELQEQKLLKTNPTEDGYGVVLFLENQNIDCGKGSALQGFHYIRPSYKTLAYEFWCSETNGVTLKTIQMATTWGDTGYVMGDKASTHYLDRHFVNCPDGYGLQQFKLNRNPINNTKINYTYTCVEAKIKGDCIEALTKEAPGSNDKGEKLTYYLESQNIKLNATQILKGFVLNNRYEKNGYLSFFTYKYVYCNLDLIDSLFNNTNSTTVNETKTNTTSNSNMNPNTNTTINETKLNTTSNSYTNSNTNIIINETKTNTTSNSYINTNPNTTNNIKIDPSILNHISNAVLLIEKQDIECGEGSVLQGFRLSYPISEKLKYMFWCQISEYTTYQYKRINSDYFHLGQPVAVNINKIILKCPDGYGLQSMRLRINPNNIYELKYEGNCVKIEMKNCEIASPEHDKDDENIFSFIIDQQVKLKSSQILKGFKMKIKNWDKDSPKFYFENSYCDLSSKISSAITQTNIEVGYQERNVERIKDTGV